MNGSQILITREGGVATVTLSNPDRHNALNDGMKAELLAALREVGAASAVRAVVLEAAGRSFSVGQDLSEHATKLEGETLVSAFSTIEAHYSPIVVELMTMAKPVVAAVNGNCVGAALGLVLACDLRVLGRAAQLGTAFTGIGLTFDTGLSFTLPRAVGHARARELLFLGRTLGAAEAVSWGISGEIVDDAKVRERAGDLAWQLSEGPTVAFAESKRLLFEGAGGSLARSLELEAQAQVRCGATTDHRAAVEAFVSRNPRVFVGR